MQVVTFVRSDNREFFGLAPADKLDGYMADGRFTPLLVRRGWCFGTAAFRQELLGQIYRTVPEAGLPPQ